MTPDAPAADPPVPAPVARQRARTMPPPDPYPPPPRNVRFSGRELLHLALSTLALGAAFAAALSCSALVRTPISMCGGSEGLNWPDLARMLGPSLLIVFFAFVLHELAHKIVAQRLGLWAEFRASFAGLGVALGVALSFGAVLASPGVVLIVGRATRRDAGLISVAGPLVNIVLAFVSAVMVALTLDSDAFRLTAEGSGGVANAFELSLFINTILAAFNMVPVRPLDGSKIIRWSVPAFIGTWLLVIALFLLFLQGPAAVFGTG